MATEAPGTPTPSADRSATLYATPGDGLKAVRDDYLYWTGRLTDSSVQLSFAVIAANWAVFASVQSVLMNPWAKSSVFLVVVSLALNLLGAKQMGELHRKRVDYAATDVERWEKECVAALGRSDPWPFTPGIELMGRTMRELRTWLPLAAGALFLGGLLAG
jgi:hypothetical protein